MVNKALFSSNSDEWSTPQEIYEALDNEFNFNLDPCSSDDNHKCDNYYTIEDNGLSKNCGGYRVFCNPPYSNISDWVKKAWREHKGQYSRCLIDTGENGYKVFSRVYLSEERDKVYKREAQVWRQ